MEEDEALFSWFLTATLPTEPYRLNSAVVVDDPALSHAYTRRDVERILAAGAKSKESRVRWAVVARLKALRERFGG